MYFCVVLNLKLFFNFFSTPAAHIPPNATCFSLTHRFGLVSKRNAGAIVDKCVLGTEGMKSNWRGNMANPGTKAEPAEKPKPAAAAATAEAGDASVVAAAAGVPPAPMPKGTTPKQEPVSSKSAAVNGVMVGRPRRESIDGA